MAALTESHKYRVLNQVLLSVGAVQSCGGLQRSMVSIRKGNKHVLQVALH